MQGVAQRRDTKDKTVVDSVVIGGSAGKSDWYMPRFQMGFGGSDVVPGYARCLPSNERDDDVTGGPKSNKKAGNNKCARDRRMRMRIVVGCCWTLNL